MRVLIVDNSREWMEQAEASVREIFPEAEIRTCPAGQEAALLAAAGKPDIALLDTDLPDMDGMTLARILQGMQDRLNIIFVSKGPERAAEAFQIHASGYMTGPVTRERILDEMRNLRYDFTPQDREDRERMTGLYLRAFGNFEAFYDGVPIPFRYSKTLELLAYLVDRNGAVCSNNEVASVLWEDDPPQAHVSYFRNLRKDLLETLESLGCADVIVRKWGGIGIRPGMIQCDYYDFLRAAGEGGDEGVRRADMYRGEYMLQYSWAEETNSLLAMMADSSK